MKSSDLSNLNNRRDIIKTSFRPFERTVTLQKDSHNHVGFIFKDGKIASIVKDSSAARNGLLIDHQLCEVNGQCVIGLKVGSFQINFLDVNWFRSISN